MTPSGRGPGATHRPNRTGRRPRRPPELTPASHSDVERLLYYAAAEHPTRRSRRWPMPRPQVHSPDAVLDAAEELLVERGRAALTIRALAERSGASNGSIYHAFGSLDTIAGAAWLRRAQRFLAVQKAGMDEALEAGS